MKNNCSLAPAEGIGLVVAQSIGEPGTQMIMKTHKFAGVSELNVSMGLPRIIEIFDARRMPSTPTMTINLKPEYAKDEKQVQRIATKILEIRLNDITEKVDVDLMNLQLEVVLNEEMLEKYELPSEEVLKVLNPLFKKAELSLKGNRVVFKFSSEANIKDVYKLKAKVKEVHIRGVPRISQVLPVKKGNEWIIKTAGSNLKEVMKLPEVDYNTIRSNDIFEILKTFGIEATRNAIIDEALDTLKDQGLALDVRHLSLVADTMTADGKIRGIGRYGVSGDKASVLARASFEVALKHLFNAAAHREIDNLTGIVENVMINQSVPIGTGLVNLVVHHDKK